MPRSPLYRVAFASLALLVMGGFAACSQPEKTPAPTPRPPVGRVIDLNAGWRTTCTVNANGRVVCWGGDESGTAPQAPTDAAFQSVGVGEHEACAIRNNGDLACWGLHPFFPIDPERIETRRGPFISVSLGSVHACAIREGGAIQCWNTDPPPDAGPFRSVSAGYRHTCAVTVANAVLCWGDDEFGQSSPPEGEFHSVSAGHRSSCGVQTDGAIFCWGDKGQIRTSPPAGTFRSVSVGFTHACGIRTDGSIDCWGTPPPPYNTFPGWADKLRPPAGVFLSVSAAAYHTCALREDGVVICWGNENPGYAEPPGYVAMSSNGADYLCEKQSGGSICWARNRNMSPATPPDIPAPTNFTAITTGDVHTCGLTDFAAIACWGYAYTPPEGEFLSIDDGCAIKGDGAIACWLPGYLDGTLAPPFGVFHSISGGRDTLGGHHFCAISADGYVHCWGFDYNGPIPSPSKSLGAFLSISVYNRDACGIRADHSLHCWHHGAGGSTTGPPDGQFQSVSVGHLHACAVRDSGKVVCWGYERKGETSPPRGKFKSVSAGGFHSCGIRLDDTLACWGANVGEYSHDNKLGSGTVYEIYYGQADPPEGKFQSVSAGRLHTCALDQNGAAVCWGADYDDSGNTYYGQATPPGGNR